MIGSVFIFFRFTVTFLEKIGLTKSCVAGTTEPDTGLDHPEIELSATRGHGRGSQS